MTIGRDRMLGCGLWEGGGKQTRVGDGKLKTVLILMAKTCFNIIETNSRKLNKIESLFVFI